MKIAIILDNKDIYVEFNESKFRELLKIMLKEFNGDSDKALDKIIALLKKETLKK